jgi:hypothetical protein
VNAMTGICWRKYRIVTPDKTPPQKRRKNKGNSELPPIVALTPKATQRRGGGELKPNCWDDARSKSCTKKHLPLQEECAPVQVCEGLLPRMNERNKVERMNYGSQSGRGASKATTFLRKNKKGICEDCRASPDTSGHVVQDGHGWSPARYMTI